MIKVNFLKNIFTKQWHEKLIREAKKHGTDEGKHGRPAPSSDSPDVFESNFKNEGSTLILKANSKVTDFIQKTGPVIQQANSELDDLEADAKINVDLDAVRNTVQSVKNSAQTSLINAYTKVIESEGYLNSFKATHNVRATPDYPKDTMHFLSIVFIVLIIEGVLNAVFWKNDTGLLGGFFTALVVAAVNICFAMSIGMLVRYVHYKSPWSSALGFSALLLGILGSFNLNLWIASIRTSHNLSQLNLPNYAVVFQDASSMILFFIGLIFAMLAAFKGYYLFGSIPGYQNVFEDFDKATKAAEIIERNLKQDIDNSISTEKNRLTKLLRNLGEINKALSKIKADIKSSGSHFDATAAEIFEAVKIIVKNYRQMNSKSRPTNIPTPDYFNEVLINDYVIIPSFYEFEEHSSEVSTRSEELFATVSVSINEQLGAIALLKSQELGDKLQLYIDDAKARARDVFITRIATFNKVPKV